MSTQLTPYLFVHPHPNSSCLSSTDPHKPSRYPMTIRLELCCWNGIIFRAQMCLLHTHWHPHTHNAPSPPSGKARVNLTKISPFHARHQFGYLRPDSRLLRQKNVSQYHQTEQHTEHLNSTKKSFPRSDSKHNSQSSKAISFPAVFSLCSETASQVLSGQVYLQDSQLYSGY